MFSFIRKYIQDLKRTDLKKINVTSQGDFYIKSKDLFDNEDASLKLIDSLKKSVEKYKEKSRIQKSPNA